VYDVGGDVVLSDCFIWPLQANRQAVEAVYETKPMPGDHKTPTENNINHFIS
jgi:hypothetical protein